MLFRIVFISAGPLCALVAYRTVVRRAGLSRGWRAFAGVLLAAGAMKFTWYAVFGGNAFVPELPAAAILAMSAVYGATIFLAAGGVAWAAWDAAAGRIRRRRTAQAAPQGREGGSPGRGTDVCTRRRFVAGALAFGSAGISLCGVHEGTRLPDVKETTLEFPDLPPEFDGYRIVQLSDLHISAAARADRTAGIARLAGALRPDLVAITGDIVDGRTDRRMEDVRPLAGLRARDGVFGCTGNHEYYSGYGEWRRVFGECGIDMIEDSVRVIRRGGGAIALFGENDPAAELAGLSSDIGPAARRRDVPAGAFRILLAHRPIRMEEHASHGMRLQLSGHTHGGAVVGLDRIVALANEGHVRGVYRECGMTLYVNAGTGQWAGFPSRFGVAPEISLLTLRRA